MSAAGRRFYDHFRDYPKISDEIWDSEGLPRPCQAALVDTLGRYSPLELSKRQQRLDRAARELGTHFAVMDDQLIEDQPWQLDLFPRVIDAGEWRHLSEGIIQRAKALNAYIKDIYNEQHILRQKIIPHDVVLSDPGFHRSLVGLPIPSDHYLLLGAFDLVRDAEGRWSVLENHVATPFGIAYVIQNRRMMAQAFPELFSSMEVSPVALFSNRITETLRQQSTRDNPHIVLLTRGETNQGYFEETFLARHMGVTLAKPADLLVRDSRVFLKTIRGLERVDVIYRRIESSSIDPIAFGESRFNGIPGLVNCVRKGKVVVVNALGAGIADNRALLRYSDRIIGHYLGERAILRTVPTYTCQDKDQAIHVFSNRDSMVLKPIHDRNTMLKYFGDKTGGELSPKDLELLLRKNRDLVVAQPYIHPSRSPRFKAKRFEPRSVFLRAFYLLGDNPCVMPGGLTRQAFESGPGPMRLTIMAEGMKDTWVAMEADEGVGATPVAKKHLDHPRLEYSISSRVAETLYWMGRYIERAENTARELNVLENVRWDQLAQSSRQIYWPLWKAVAAATGQSDLARLRKPPADTLKLSRQLVLDTSEPSSVINSIRSAHINGQAVRDTISPEFWQALNALADPVEEAARHKRTGRERLRQVCQQVVDGVARAMGVAERTLLHDDGWQFFRMGLFQERAIEIATITEAAILRTLADTLSGKEEETDLTALLRLLASLDAYRRVYRSRAYIDRVAHLLLKSPNNPHSIAYCLRNLRYAITTLALNQPDRPSPVVPEIDRLLETLKQFPLGSLLPTPADDFDLLPGSTPTPEKQAVKDLRERFGNLRESLIALHPLLEDCYFSHQREFLHHEQLEIPTH